MTTAKLEGLQLVKADDWDKAGEAARFIVFKNPNERWRWHLLGHGLTKVIARSGQTYSTAAECVEALTELLKESNTDLVWMADRQRWYSTDIRDMKHTMTVG